jgi:hypothetical protein
MPLGHRLGWDDGTQTGALPREATVQSKTDEEDVEPLMLAANSRKASSLKARRSRGQSMGLGRGGQIEDSAALG